MSVTLSDLSGYLFFPSFIAIGLVQCDLMSHFILISAKTVIQQFTFVPFFHFGIFVPCFGFYGSQLFGFSSRSPTQSSCPAGNTASRLLDVIIGNFSTKPLNRVTI